MPKGCLKPALDRTLVMAEESDPTYLKVLYLVTAPEVSTDKCMASCFSESKKSLRNFSFLLIMHRHLWPSPKTATIYSFAASFAPYSVKFPNHKQMFGFFLCFFTRLSECFLLLLVTNETYVTLFELVSKNENILITINSLLHLQ